jgi:hypothetical protein
MVRTHTAGAAEQFRLQPEAFDHSWALFRVMDLLTVLQRDVGICYDPKLMEGEDFFRDSRNLFIHGVIENGRGSCSSLPPLVVAVGRRLGYPLRLVATKYHLFARWESEEERFNVECTSRGLNCHPDGYYLTWPAHTALGEARAFGFLRSQEPRDELAGFLATRGHCLLDNGWYTEAAQAYAAAGRLQPWNSLHALALRETLGKKERETGVSSFFRPHAAGKMN